MARQADAEVSTGPLRLAEAVEALQPGDGASGPGRALRNVREERWSAPTGPWRVALLGLVAAFGAMFVTGAASRLLNELGANPPQATSRPSAAAAPVEPQGPAGGERAAVRPPQVAAAPAVRAWQVQVGAFRDAASAERHWVSLQSSHPEVARLQPFQENYQGLTRLRLGSFGTRAEARNACRKILAAGRDCYAVASGP